MVAVTTSLKGYIIQYILRPELKASCQHAKSLPTVLA